MGFLSPCVTAFNLMMLFRNSVPFSGPRHINYLWEENQKINSQFPLKRGIIVVVDYKLRLHSQRRGERALDSKVMRGKACCALCGAWRQKPWSRDCSCCTGDMTLGRSSPHVGLSPHSQMDSSHSGLWGSTEWGLPKPVLHTSDLI